VEDARIVWDRECAFAALLGLRLCPRHRMPCWVCCLLHTLTGTLRSVAEGRFDRFAGFGIFTWAEDTDGHFARSCASRGLICPHHHGALTADYRRRLSTDADLYWYAEFPPPSLTGNGPSRGEWQLGPLTTTPVTPARKVSDGESQAEATEESASRMFVL